MSDSSHEQGVKENCRRIIDSVDNLPSLPAIVTRLLEVVNSPDSSVEDVVSLIEKDPALTSKCIRLANSAFYGMPRTVSAISNAVVILGFNVIRSLVLSIAVMKMFSGMSRRAISQEVFWEHSIAVALSAREVVRHLMAYRMVDPESAFCAGMLHDIGKMIFDVYAPREYAATCEHAAKKRIPLIAAETAIMGIDHARIGGLLAEKWGLPIDLENVIVYHHDPARSGTSIELVNIVHFSDGVAHDIGAGLWEDEARTPEWEESRSRLSIDDECFERIRSRTEDAMASSIEFLSIIR